MAAAASPSDLSVKVGAGSSEFVFPEDRNRYRYSFPEHKTARHFSSMSHAVDRGGLMPESGDWSVDQSPERLQPQTKIEIQKPRLSRVQLPTCVYSRHLRMVLSFAYQSLRLQLFCRHFSIDDLERSENDFERAQW